MKNRRQLFNSSKYKKDYCDIKVQRRISGVINKQFLAIIN